MPNHTVTGPVARLFVARAAALDAARCVRLSAQEPRADIDRCLALAARLNVVAEELHAVEAELAWSQGH